MERTIDSIKIGERFRKDLGDIGSLAQSIKEIGLLHPIVIQPNGTLIAGKRRLEACKSLGWQTIAVTEVDLEDIVRGEHDENVHRKDFLPSEAIAVGQALEPMEREKAKERERSHTEAGYENFSDADKGESLAKVASAVGMSKPTYEKAKAVVEAARQEPQKYKPLVEEMDKTKRVSGVYRKLKVAQQEEEILREPPPTPQGPFRVIVADPPWPYYKRKDDPSHRASLPYPDMTSEQIKAMKVASLAADDAILWLWTTNAHLQVAFEVVEAWGFEYKTLLTWEKNKMGTGDWLRGKTEHCMMAIKGKPVVTLTNQTTIIHGDVREHSRKPDEFYALVDSLCPGSKLELFARTEREGWTSHGDETKLFS
jgi:N6-adenosine-specific RNA methylase IME4/ParB-like chromosome segregation protein Spo0J